MVVQIMMLNKNAVLILLCGLPSSGKSIFAKLLGDHLSNDLQRMNINIIDIDQVRKELYKGEFEPENESFVRETALMQTRNHLKMNSITIIDDVNYYSSMRHEFKQIADELGKSFLILYISTPLEICLKWNAKRKNALESQVITKISENFDPPGHKYLWDAPFEIINMAENDITVKINQISEKIITMVMEKPNEIEKKNGTYQSNTHIIDNLTRMFINFYTNSILNPESDENKEWINTELINLKINVIHQASALPQFQQLQSKFTKKIELMNKLRRRYIENTQFEEHSIIDEKAEKKLVQILVDFMDYLLK
jgi:O-phosphoseryl-tRNA(Sec) kinase